MILSGCLLALAGLLFIIFSTRWKNILGKKWWLVFIAWLTPIGFIAVEAGWTVTETGRQPWIIYGVMKTKDAVSTMPGLQYSFYSIMAVYVLLTIIIIWLMRKHIARLQTDYPSAKIETE